MSSYKLRVIFFDFGQTLTDLSGLGSCMSASITKHIPRLRTDLQRFVYRWGQETHNLFMKKRYEEYMTTREIHFLCLKNMLKPYHISLSDETARIIVDEVWTDFIHHSILFPDVIPVLKQLKQSGYKLGIISDCDKDVAEGIIRNHHLSGYFDVLIISSVFRLYKPNPILFHEALKLANCVSNEGLYVGDSGIDIKGAKDVGLTTVIVQRSTLLDSKSEVQPDFRIDSLGRLPELVSEINKT